jgi:hypothetical protein
MDTQAHLVQEENRRIRLLAISADLLVQTLMTAPVTLAEADRMIQGMRALALNLFPDKGEVFDLIYVPRFRRALREAGIVQRHTPALVPEASSFSEAERNKRETDN